ncbi:hypothetical protein AVEN_209344-1 [Araneus ventricosus]|uniref:Uncharacterized protein n=1 Tax=Araneus ventricosus TaxID=182803 RepID=A0A4Y2CCU2_ARAVE|nr:hypothetical protein AVEN_209344-1 [Araneus ventricosus]
MSVKNVESDDFLNIDMRQNIQDVRSTLIENHRITICELPEECSISYGSFQPNLTEYVSVRCLLIFVPKPLSADQKEARFSALIDLLECIEHEENILKVIERKSGIASLGSCVGGLTVRHLSRWFFYH